jgi:hypothetical protein
MIVQPRSEAFGAPTPNGPVGQNRNNHAIVRKILVIEDEPKMYRNLTIILRLENFHPLPALPPTPYEIEKGLHWALPSAIWTKFKPVFTSRGSVPFSGSQTSKRRVAG